MSDEHDETMAGCWACGTCICHDSCADPDNPIDFDRGDCPECGACGDCIRACEAMRPTVEPISWQEWAEASARGELWDASQVTPR